MQRGHRGGRRRLAPQRVHQPVLRDDLVRAQQQVAEQRALPAALDRERTAILHHLQRPKDPELDARPPRSARRYRIRRRADSESLAARQHRRRHEELRRGAAAARRGRDEVAAAGERARIAAEQLTREGTAVRCVRSVYLPEEDTCLLVFEAPTPEAVDLAGRRAGLTYDRIVEGDAAVRQRASAIPSRGQEAPRRRGRRRMRGRADRRPRHAHGPRRPVRRSRSAWCPTSRCRSPVADPLFGFGLASPR